MVKKTIAPPNNYDYRRVMGEEIAIAVMGVTGAGKSHFIRAVTGDARIEVGDGMRSCTDKIQAYRFTDRSGLNITLVDTPGFNDTYRTDTDILRDIATWMELSYRQGFKLSGIIYLHPITAMRMEGSALRNLRMFRKLCGEDALKHVFLATTHWHAVEEEVGMRRVKELGENGDFWKGLMDHGAKVTRFTGDRESGMGLVDALAGMGRVTLGIQRELVEEGKELYQTAAGEAVHQELIEMRKRHEADLKAARAEWLEALKDKDEELKEVLARERQRLEEKLDQVERDRESLRQERRREVRDQEVEWHRRLRALEAVQAEEREDQAKTREELEERIEKLENTSPWSPVLGLVIPSFLKLLNKM